MCVLWDSLEQNVFVTELCKRVKWAFSPIRDGTQTNEMEKGGGDEVTKMAKEMCFLKCRGFAPLHSFFPLPQR